MPIQKTAGCGFEYFAAELAGCELAYDSKQQAMYRVPHSTPDIRDKHYKLPYLRIQEVSRFGDTQDLCIILERADNVSWLGANTFADEDITLFEAE